MKRFLKEFTFKLERSQMMCQAMSDSIKKGAPILGAR
jgi:hypothetical protein